MKTLLLIMFVASFQSAFCQKSADCDVLTQVLNDPYAKVFKLQFVANPDQPIVIVDTSKFFKSCSIVGQMGRRFQIVHDVNYLDGTTEFLIVYVNQRRRRQYQIDLYSKSSHGICTVFVREKNGKLHWSEVKCGTLD